MAHDHGSPRDYLTEINAEFYLNDAVALLLKARPDRPLEFLRDYLTTVKAQQHVVSRDFTFINATTHNRRSFLGSCREAFGHIDESKEMVIGDLYQLVALLCPTMPEGRVYELPRLLKVEHAARLRFGDLFTAFSVHFAYYDSLLELKHIFVQPLLPGSPPEWRSIDLATVRAHVLRRQHGGPPHRQQHNSADKLAATKPPTPAASLDLRCEVPLRFIEEAFGLSVATGSSGESAAAAAAATYSPPPSAITFDELLFRLLKSKELAAHFLLMDTGNWRARDAYPEVADLFLKHNSKGEAGPEDDERFLKASKPKLKEKGKTQKKSTKACS
mmetsp:Transcript_54772/g.110097  ORF Transcript_54772/g.110097 Transcript_54772/m.110097 type:complete len:330 (+) Transcript_54772:178-1167(+)